MTTIMSSEHGYALRRSGPDVASSEVESAHETVVEVVVLWGATVLHVAHVDPSRGFVVGEASGAARTCDFHVPSESIGSGRASLVAARSTGPALVLPLGSRGHLETPDGRSLPLDLDALVASGAARASADLAGAHEVDLPQGARVSFQLAGCPVTFQIASVKAGKRVSAGTGLRDPSAIVFGGLSLVMHLGLISACALFLPHLGASDAEDLDRDQILTLQRMLEASSERERDRPPIDAGASARPVEEGRASSAAAGSSGTAGTHAKTRDGRYAIARTTATFELARRTALDEAAGWIESFGLRAVATGSPDAPSATWGRDVPSGLDPRYAQGDFFGRSIDDATGTGGLGPSGPDQGGGGPSDVIGTNGFGPLDRIPGDLNPDGTGHSRAILPGTHQPRSPGVRAGPTTVSGHLLAEVIQRTVRLSFGRFRFCYEAGLRDNPGLEGRVMVKFLIDRSGAVETALDAGSDLPDPKVVQCVVRAFKDLSFTAPEGGVVTVTYPLAFTPAD